MANNLLFDVACCLTLVFLCILMKGVKEMLKKDQEEQRDNFPPPPLVSLFKFNALSGFILLFPPVYLLWPAIYLPKDLKDKSRINL